MKLLVTAALFLSMALSACGKSPKVVRTNGNTTMTNLTVPTMPQVYKNVDGNYVSVQPKGYVDDKGQEVVTGELINLYQIQGSTLTGYEIDLEQKNYTSFVNKFNVMGRIAMLSLTKHSCDSEDFEIMHALNKDYAALATVDEKSITVTALEVPQKSETMMKVSEEETQALLNSLKTLEHLNAANCKKMASGLNRTETSLEKIQARVTELANLN